MSVQRMEGAARAPRFSLIIPAYNEEAYLPRLLDSVDGARAR
jgi:glycosyltransferase involved in cell wall biosynthesis